MPQLDADSLSFRAAVLLLCSFCPVGSNLPREMYSALQPTMTKLPSCSADRLTNSTDCCTDCIGLGDQNYNLIFSIMFFCSAFALSVTGFLMDKFGNSVIIPIQLSAFIGCCLIALGSCIRHSPLSLVSIFTGAAFLGLGYYPSFLAKDRIVAVWFKDKEMGLAFGISSAIVRVASLVTYSFSAPLRAAVGLQVTLWIGAAVSLLALACGVCVSLLDAHGIRQLQLTETVRQERRSVRLTDPVRLGSQFWLVALMFIPVCAGFNTLQDNLTEFIHEKFSMSREAAAMVAGAVRYVGIVSAPLSGLLLDAMGHTAHGLLAAIAAMLPGTALLAFTRLHPVVGVCVVGLAGSFVNVGYACATTLVVQSSKVGTAFSLSLGFTCAAMGCLHAGVGTVLGRELSLPITIKLLRWNTVMLLLLGVFVVGLCFSVALVFVSHAKHSELVTGRSSATSEAKYERIEGADSETE